MSSLKNAGEIPSENPPSPRTPPRPKKKIKSESPEQLKSAFNTPVHLKPSPLKPRGLLKRRKLELSDQKVAEVSKAALPPLFQQRKEIHPILLEQYNLVIKKLSVVEDPELFAALSNRAFEWVYESKLSKKQCMAELGALYFYLCKSPKQLPIRTSYVRLRLEELEGQIKGLESGHQEHCPVESQKLIPTGKVAYLLRAFARMIVTPDGHFNRGGCYTVKMLIFGRLNIHLSETRYWQILTVIDTLLEKKDLLEQLMTPFQVCPELQELIRIDLKLSHEANIPFLYVQWDLLIALFSVFGQIDEPNCFAISTASNFQAGHLDFILKVLIQALTQGTFLFGQLKIPIKPILASKRKYEKDFQINISEEHARQLTGFKVAQKALHLDCIRPVSPQTSSMREVFSAFGSQATYAEEIVITMKKNLIHEMTLSILQFVALNGLTKRKIPTENKTFVAWRTVFFMGIQEKLLAQFTNTETRDFFERLKQAIEKRLFLIDAHNWEITLNEDHNRVSFDFFSHGLIYTGNKKLYTPFKNQRGLYFLKNDTFVPIQTLTAFGQALKAVAEEIYEEKLDRGIKGQLKQFGKFLSEETFRETSAHLIAQQNWKMTELPAEVYKDSDALLLAQRGGDAALITGSTYIPFVQPVPAIQTPSKQTGDFFLLLCAQLTEYQLKNTSGHLKRHNPQLLVSTSAHAFNLHPQHFSDFWKGDTKTLLNQRVIQPGKALLQKYLNQEQQLLTLTHALGAKRGNGVFKQLKKEKKQPKAFVKELESCVTREEMPSLIEATKHVLGQISMPDFLFHLPNLLKSVGINANFNSFLTIHEEVKKLTEDAPYCSPYTLTSALKKALLKADFHFVPHHKLESAICQEYGYPHVIELGSLNWVTEITEKLSFSTLVIQWNFQKAELELAQRQEGVIKPLVKELLDAIYERTELFFES